MLTGIHLSGLCLLSRGGWCRRCLPQVTVAGCAAIRSPYLLPRSLLHQPGVLLQSRDRRVGLERTRSDGRRFLFVVFILIFFFGEKKNNLSLCETRGVSFLLMWALLDLSSVVSARLSFHGSASVQPAGADFPPALVHFFVTD